MSSARRAANPNGPVVLVSKPIEFTFPLGYAYLAAYLRQMGHEVHILYKDGDVAKLAQRIFELKPVLVGFGTLYPELREIAGYIQLLDKLGRNFPVVIGGQMVSPTPEFAVRVTGADFGVVGEGEIVLHQLVEALREGRDPTEVKGLAVRQGDAVALTGPGEYIKDLSQLPPVPYEMFPVQKWLHIGRWYAKRCPQPHWKLEDRVISVHGGRGCPFRCNFCYHHSRPRYREIPHMMAEAGEALERYRANMLYFSDDLVLPSPKRAAQLVEEIAKLKKPIEFSASVRFDILDRIGDDTLWALKQAGCRIMGLGVESGSDRILKIIGKSCTSDTVLRNLDRLRRVGIMPTVSIMVGQHTETWDDVEASIRLMRESVRNNPLIQYAFTVTTPFPGSKLYDLAFEKGLLRDDQDFYDRYFSAPGEFKQVVNLSAMSERQVVEACAKLNQVYAEEKQRAANGPKGAVQAPKEPEAAPAKAGTATLMERALRELVKPGWACCDLGAGMGLHALMIGEMIGPEGKLVAFEADQGNAAILRNNVLMKGLQSRIEVRGGEAATAGAPTYPSLDLEFPSGSRLDIVRLDVAGGLLLVLAGMRRILKEQRPLLLLRIHDETDWAARAKLRQAGYALSDLDGNIISDDMRERVEACLAIHPGQPGRTAPESGKKADASAAIRPSPPARPRPAPKLNERTCAFVNTYYQDFLKAFYSKRPGLLLRPHAEQLEALIGERFGDSDFYSRGFAEAGWTAHDFIVNCDGLQRAWAKEHGYAGKGMEIALEQIRRLRPAVTYIQDLTRTDQAFLEAIRPFTGLIVGQTAYPLAQDTPLHLYDILFSSFPHYVERFRKAGLCAHYLPLAFDPRVLEEIEAGRHVEHADRPIPVSFIGGLSGHHGGRYELLERLAAEVPLQVWGYGAESLPQDAPLRALHQGEAWGKNMFSLLGDSRITVNLHIGVAENNANNMRLFEATGCGALLITDYKDNLQDLFDIGREVVAYRSPEECAALVRYYLAHPDEAAEIARNGQQRTLRDHSYAARMEQTTEILERHLRYERERAHYSSLESQDVSSGYTEISRDAIQERHAAAWKDASIPVRQRALTQKQLREMYSGAHVNPPFAALAEMLRPILEPGASILEIGCASGYYCEVLEYLLNRRLNYTGVDYSEPLIAMARDYYPKKTFIAADGADMPFEDGQFSVVVSSSILLHVPNYSDHIAETARVAGKYVIAHRTPVSKKKPTSYYTKLAYGVETMEICFNENEILKLFSRHGLTPVSAMFAGATAAADEYHYTYLFRKTSR